jgi:hypothetical protein
VSGLPGVLYLGRHHRPQADEAGRDGKLSNLRDRLKQVTPDRDRLRHPVNAGAAAIAARHAGTVAPREQLGPPGVAVVLDRHRPPTDRLRSRP